MNLTSTAQRASSAATGLIVAPAAGHKFDR
jgi:hypothetical protein